MDAREAAALPRMLSATTRDPDLHLYVIAHGTREMIRALACNAHLSEPTRKAIFHSGDDVARARVAALTADEELIRAAMAHPHLGTREAGAANVRAGSEELARAASEGNVRALLNCHTPESVRRKHWTAAMAGEITEVTPRRQRSPLVGAARARAVAFAAPWLAAEARGGALRSAWEEHESLSRGGFLDMDETDLALHADGGSHAGYALVALAVANPLSPALKDHYARHSESRVRYEPYSLAIAVSAHGADVHNPWGSSTPGHNPTWFASPLCRLDTAWEAGTPEACREHESVLLRDRRVAETVVALAEEWHGSITSLLSAAQALLEDTSSTGHKTDRGAAWAARAETAVSCT